MFLGHYGNKGRVCDYIVLIVMYHIRTGSIMPDLRSIMPYLPRGTEWLSSTIAKVTLSGA